MKRQRNGPLGRLKKLRMQTAIQNQKNMLWRCTLSWRTIFTKTAQGTMSSNGCHAKSSIVFAAGQKIFRFSAALTATKSHFLHHHRKNSEKKDADEQHRANFPRGDLRMLRTDCRHLGCRHCGSNPAGTAIECHPRRRAWALRND